MTDEERIAQGQVLLVAEKALQTAVTVLRIYQNGNCNTSLAEAVTPCVEAALVVVREAITPSPRASQSP